MGRLKVEDKIQLREGRSFNEVAEAIIREQRPSPEQLAQLIGCTVPVLMEKLRGRPIRLARCLEWADHE